MNFKDFIIHQIVFETRYNQGYRYLDRCGETMIELENKHPGWQADEAGPGNGRMIYLPEQIVFNFSNLKMDIAQYDIKKQKYENFLSYLESFFLIVSQNLGLKSFSRFGLRYWLLLPLETADKGRKILNNCKTYDISQDIEKEFDNKIKDTSVTIVLENDVISHRIAISMAYKKDSGLEMPGGKILKTPPHKLPRGQREALQMQMKQKKKLEEQPDIAIMIDIDTYVNNPKQEDLKSFIKKARDITYKKTPLLLN